MITLSHLMSTRHPTEGFLDKFGGSPINGSKLIYAALADDQADVERLLLLTTRYVTRGC